MTRVEVTANDIVSGKRFLPGQCPIALAIQRLDTAFCHVRVFGGAVQRYGEILAMLPEEAYQWYLRYDADKEVEPITFEISL